MNRSDLYWALTQREIARAQPDSLEERYAQFVVKHRLPIEPGSGVVPKPSWIPRGHQTPPWLRKGPEGWQAVRYTLRIMEGQ